MIDIVNLPLAHFQVDQVAHHFNDVLRRQCPFIQRDTQAQFLIDLETADRREVILLWIEEQIVKQGLGRFDRRRLTGS